MQIAVATSNGEKVDVHFGKAKEFSIYKWDAPKWTLVGKRATQSYCKCSDCGPHDFFTDRFEMLYDVIKDCQAVFVESIGDTPAKKLKEKGINPVIYTGLVAEIPEVK